MDFDRIDELVSPSQQAAAVGRYKAQLSELSEGHHHGEPSVREVTYGTHVIRIVTTYEIEVDGQPVTGHMLVTNEGTLHYHAIPNQEFPSAIDMVKRMIDLAPEQFPDPPPPDQHGDHPPDHGDHGDHPPDHGDHPDHQDHGHMHHGDPAVG
jgi:hypothetical protein